MNAFKPILALTVLTILVVAGQARAPTDATQELQQPQQQQQLPLQLQKQLEGVSSSKLENSDRNLKVETAPAGAYQAPVSYGVSAGAPQKLPVGALADPATRVVIQQLVELIGKHANTW